jgi:hypothetical protein
VGLAIGGPNAKANFKVLNSQRPDIEKITGPMEWDEAPGKTISNIWIRRPFDPDEAKWQEQFAWLRDKLEALDEAFRQRVSGLKTSLIPVQQSESPDMAERAR